MDTRKIESILRLEDLCFEKVLFERIGSKNNNAEKHSISVRIGENTEERVFRVILTIKTKKLDEYNIELSLRGVFSFNEEIDIREKREFIRSNAVAIMMPYLRSELTLMTSQPGVEPIVLPPFNVQALLKKRDSCASEEPRV